MYYLWTIQSVVATWHTELTKSIYLIFIIPGFFLFLSSLDTLLYFLCNLLVCFGKAHIKEIVFPKTILKAFNASSSFIIITKLSIEHSKQSCYIIDVKRTTAHWVSWPDKLRSKATRTDQSIRVVFAMYCYLQNVKTNVSNARMNIPKAIKSLKSKWFFLSISITPIL